MHALELNKQAVAGVQLTIPLYQGGRPAAQVRQTQALESQAIEQEIEIERGVIAQTRAAYASWQASLQTIDSNQKAVDAASLSLEGVRAENSVGSRTILDILVCVLPCLLLVSRIMVLKIATPGGGGSRVPG